MTPPLDIPGVVRGYQGCRSSKAATPLRCAPLRPIQGAMRIQGPQIPPGNGEKSVLRPFQ